MPYFKDRTDAGVQLAVPLKHLAGPETLVLAIPRGGIEVGCRVARGLGVPFSVMVTRKLPFPDNPEAGFGAVAEDGSTHMVDSARFGLRGEEVQRIVEEQKQELRRRVETLRRGQPLPDLTGRTAILVDDGIAMGSTMTASAKACRNLGAARVVSSAPVASPRAVASLERIADEVVVLHAPARFRAVAEAYETWYDVSDAEALEVMARHEDLMA